MSATLGAKRTETWQERTLSSAKHGAMAGSAWGAYAGAQQGRAAGLAGQQLLRAAAKRSVLSTAGFGVFMAVYTSTVCQLEHLRNGKRDLGNSLLAGLATGAVLAVHTRKLPVVAVSSALSGALMVSVDAAGAAFDHIAGSLMDRVPRD